MRRQNELNQRTRQFSFGSVGNAIEIFMRDRSARSLSDRTLEYYERVLSNWKSWLSDNDVEQMDEITADVVRQYMLSMEDRGHNPGGVALYFRAAKALSRFWEEETDGKYRDPFRKVRPPKVTIKPIPGIPVDDVMKMIDGAQGKLATRDTAILLALLDTGARRGEFCAMDVGDVDLEEGKIKIRKGKGDKERKVFIGKRTRRILRRYLRERKQPRPDDPLWITQQGDRITAWGLRELIRRRANDVGLEREPGVHDFRRAFALAMQRNGADIITISRTLGHTSLEVLKRYLDQDENDLRRAHEHSSPVDNA